MSYVFFHSISLLELTQPVQVYRRANLSPQAPRHGTPPPLKSLHSSPSPPTPTFSNSPHPIRRKEWWRKQHLSYQEVVSPVVFCHLSLKSGQHLSSPSYNSSLKETTGRTLSCLPPWFLSSSTHSPQTKGQARSTGSNQRVGTAAFLERRTIRPYMDELEQIAGFSSIFL